MKPVTDPNILNKLNGGLKPVTDPALVARLEGNSPSLLQRAKDFVKDAASNVMVESDMAAESSKVPLSSVGRGVMRGYAKTADTALALADVFHEKDTPSLARKLQTKLTEPAIKHWTKQGPTDAFEQVGEALGEIGSAVTLGPAAIPAMAGNATYQTGKELIEGGASLEEAQKAALIQGGAMAAMGAIPAAGKTIPKTLGLATANPVIGATSRYATQQVLSDKPELAKQFDPLDPVALGMDVASAGLAIPAHLKLKAEAAKTPRPNHDTLTEGITAKDSLGVPSEVKPVVKGTPEEMLALDNEGALEGKVLHQKGDAVYAIDPKAIEPEQAKAAIEKGGDAESAVLGYPNREGIAPEKTVDVAVTKQGEVVSDLPQMKAEKEAGNIAWAAEGEPKAATAKAEEVAGAIKKNAEESARPATEPDFEAILNNLDAQRGTVNGKTSNGFFTDSDFQNALKEGYPNVRRLYESLKDKNGKSALTPDSIKSALRNAASGKKLGSNQQLIVDAFKQDHLDYLHNNVRDVYALDLSVGDTVVKPREVDGTMDTFKVIHADGEKVVLKDGVIEEHPADFGDTIKAAEVVKGKAEQPLDDGALPPELPPKAENGGTGTPDTRESQLAVRAEADAIAAKLTEDFGDLPEYQTMSMKEQADRATSIMDTDYEAAKRMAMGEELPPNGVREATMYEAVKIRAIKEGDVETLRKLATESTVPGKLSEYGQAIKAADSRIMDDPVKAMQEVVKTRKDTAERTGTTPSDARTIDELSRKLDEVTARLAAVEEAAAKKQAEKTVKKIRQEVAATTKRRERRTATKQALDAEFQDLSKQLNKILNPNKLNAGIDPAAIPVLLEMARNRVRAGINSVEGIVEHIYREVKDIIDVTRRDIRDAISGYGKTSKMNQDEIEVQLRELKRQARLVSALEDAHSGKFPLRSGLKRDPVSDKVRRLQKEVKQAMRESGIDSKATLSPEERFKSSLDAVKTRLKNQISDLEKQLATGEKTPKRKGIEYDAEARALVEQRDKLKSAIEAIEGKKGMTDAQRVTVAISAVKKSIIELTRRIKEHDTSPTQKPTRTPETPELKALRAERDKLRTEYESNKKLYEDMKKQSVPDEDPMLAQQRKFTAEAERKARAAEKALQKSIDEYKRRIGESDLNPQKKTSSTPETPTTAKLRAEREKLIEVYKQMKEDAKPPKDPEAVRLKSFKTRLNREIAKFEKALKEGDFAPKEERKATNLDPEGQKLKAERDRLKKVYQDATSAVNSITKEEAAEIVRLYQKVADARTALENGGDRMVYGAARVEYENYVNDLKGANLPIKSVVKNRAKEFKKTWGENKARAVFEAGRDALSTITNNSIAMAATLDNSFLGRQGLKTLMTHPTAWWPGARKSFSDFAKTLGGKNAHNALMADIYSRPNYLNGEYERAKIIAKNEEQYPTTLPERIPGVGRVLKASEHAFTGSALRMRTDLYDMLSTMAKENGVNMAEKANAESLGKLINSLTARGQWGKRGEGTVVRLILWAPKMLKANLDVLTMHNFGAGLENSFARKQAATNLLKIVAETATVMAIANALVPGSAETNPTSSDFGTIKVGDTRFDITGGAASIVTLASRIVTRSSKSTQTGLSTQYGLGYGKRSPFDALVDFVTNKTSPPAGVVVRWLKGKNRDNTPFTWNEAAYGSFVPISLQNIINLKDEASADRVAGAILDLIGISANSYGDDSEQRGDIVERIRSRKPLTEDQKAAYGKMTRTQKKNIKKDSRMTATQAAFSRMSHEDMVYAWGKLSDNQKAELKSIYTRKMRKHR